MKVRVNVSVQRLNGNAAPFIVERSVEDSQRYGSPLASVKQSNSRAIQGGLDAREHLKNLAHPTPVPTLHRRYVEGATKPTMGLQEHPRGSDGVLGVDECDWWQPPLSVTSPAERCARSVCLGGTRRWFFLRPLTGGADESWRATERLRMGASE